MRSSKSRSRSKQNRPRSIGNIVNRVFDSSGPEGKVRGTPQQIIEKYQALARDAQLSNDRVAAENFLQHAEHYTRMLGEAMRELAAEQENRRQYSNSGHNGGQDRHSHQPRREERGEDEQPEIGAVPAFAFEIDEAESGLVETPESRPETGVAAEPRADFSRSEQSRDEQPRTHQPREQQPRREREFQRNDRFDREPRADREPRTEREPRTDREPRMDREPRVEREQRTEREPQEPRADREPRAERDSREDRRPARSPRVERAPRAPRADTQAAPVAAPAEVSAPVADEAPKPRRPRAPRKTADAAPATGGTEAAE